MKKCIVTMLAFSTLLGSVFAQQSMTNKSTASLFTTEVDDFINVNEWQNVKVEKVFGFVDYAYLHNTKHYMNAGAAGNIGSFYMGGYLGGQTPELKGDTKKPAGGNTVKTSQMLDGSVTGKMIFGFKNMGILASLKFEPEHLKTETDYDANVVIKKRKYLTDGMLRFGINLAGERPWKVHFEAGLESKKNQEYTTVKDDVTTLTNDSTHHLRFLGGAGLEFSKSEKISQEIGFQTGIKCKLWEKETAKDTEEKGKFEIEIPSSVGYKLTYTHSPTFALKFGASLAVPITHKKGLDETVVSGTSSYAGSREHKTSFAFKPALQSAISWQAVPEKFALNLGVSFSPIEFNYTHTKTESRDTSSGSVNDTSTTGEWKFTSNKGNKFAAQSGFAWFITKNITLDANCNFFSAYFNDDLNFEEKKSTELLIPEIGLQIAIAY